MTTAERAAPAFAKYPGSPAHAPGQFAFADQNRVRGILEKSGWSGVDIRPVDLVCNLPEKELVGYFTRLGPVGRVLQEVDERTRTGVIATIRAAFDPYVKGANVRFDAACWRWAPKHRDNSRIGLRQTPPPLKVAMGSIAAIRLLMAEVSACLLEGWQRPFHHRIRRGQRDAKMPRGIHDRARHHEDIAVGKGIPQPLGVPVRPFAPKVERTLGLDRMIASVI